MLSLANQPNRMSDANGQIRLSVNKNFFKANLKKYIVNKYFNTQTNQIKNTTKIKKKKTNKNTKKFIQFLLNKLKF